MTAPANRGKKAEKLVKDLLAEFESTRMGFTFNRVQDAHSAGGRFTPTAGDFQAFLKTDVGSRNFVIEVKELKHPFRLPSKSYSADKVARVQKRVLAGSEAIVLIYHTVQCEWRVVPFAVFTERKSSWDLSAYAPVTDIEQPLKEFLGL